MRRLILIADDEEVNRQVLGELFERRGYRVQTACDGVEAMERARHPDVSLGIFDYQMPELNGLEALKRLREVGRLLPVIMMTAHRSPHLRRSALACGAQGFFTKPLDLKTLRDTVVSLIGEELSITIREVSSVMTVTMPRRYEIRSWEQKEDGEDG